MLGIHVASKTPLSCEFPVLALALSHWAHELASLVTCYVHNTAAPTKEKKDG